MSSDPRRSARSLGQAAKDFVKRAAVRQGLLVRRVPRGRHTDPFADQAGLLGGRPVKAIVDVGAYVGETALEYRRLFPGADIHCFEPVPASHEELLGAVGTDPHVHPSRLVLGDLEGEVEININISAPTSSTLGAAEHLDAFSAGVMRLEETRRVPATTLDAYCAKEGIDHIDILKLDIQGGEMSAARGAQGLLARGAVSLIYTEVLVRPIYSGQPGPGELLSAFEAHGYQLYGLYNLSYSADSSLYQMDAILLSPELARRAAG